MCVLLFDTFNGCSSSIKEINRLIWKGMSNIYYWEKLTFSKLRFSWKENLKKCTNFEEQKGTRYVWGSVYIGIIVFSSLSSTKSCLRILLSCFVRETKGNELLRKWGWFQGRNEPFLPNIFAKNWKFRKLRHGFGFADERAMIKTTLMSSCYWKTLVPFCLRKKNLKMHF